MWGLGQADSHFTFHSETNCNGEKLAEFMTICHEHSTSLSNRNSQS